MKQSQLFTKTRKNISEQDTSINAQLLERAGYISKLMSGVYSYLPLGLKVLFNIENIVREEMNKLDAQEILMPSLQPKENWTTTQRWDAVDVLFKLKGSGDKDLCLGPTHEEIVTPLVGQYIQSYKDLPIYTYQIQTKFRNEPRAKSGILRCREFRMKDLYSFHTTQEDLDSYYEKATQAYKTIFERCGLGEHTYLTYASGGIFSKYSHEFQTVTPYGEDIVFLCKNCKIAINKEIIEDQNSCPSCNNTELETQKAIEVGNIFKLSTKFSDAFKLSYTDSSGAQMPVLMGCYGIGTSRLIGAIVETLHDDKGIIWPKEVSPFDVHLISLGREAEDIEKANELYETLEKNNIKVLYDDREGVQAGQKFADSDLIGIPVRIVISKKTIAQNSVEVKERTSQEAKFVDIDNLVKTLLNS